MASIIGALAVELGLNSASFHAGIGKASDASKQFSKELKESFAGISESFRSIGESFGSVGGQLASSLSSVLGAISPLKGEMGSLVGISGSFATAAVAAGVAALGIAVKFSETAARLDELSQSTGVSVENLSLLGDVAKTKGIGVDEMGHALQKMSRSAYEASIGSGKAIQAFNDLGISVTNSNGSMKPTIELFNEVAAKFKDMPDGPRKTAEAMQIFGRGAANLISVLNMSGEKLKDLEGHFAALNDVISGPTAAASAELKEQMSLISGGFEGIENEITKQLVPALLVVTKEMVGAFEGQQDNIKFVIEAVAGIAKGLLNCGQAAALFGELLGEVLTFGVGFKQLGQDIQKVAGAMLSAANGDWKGAYEGMREAAVGSLTAIGNSNQRVVDDIKNSIKSIGDVWSASLPAASKPNNQEGAPAAEPIVEFGAKDEFQMFRRYKKEGEEYEKLKEAKLKGDEQVAEEERRATDAVMAEIQKNADAWRRNTAEQIENNERIAESANKNKAAGDAAGVKALAALNLISKRDEQQQLATIDAKELDDYTKTRKGYLETLKNNLQQMQDAQAAAKGTGGEAQATEKATAAQRKYDEAVRETIKEQQKLKSAIGQDEIEAQKLASTWGSYFGKMKTETQDLGKVLRTTFQSDLTTAITGFSKALGTSIVEGKNLGTAMKTVAKEIAASFVESAAEMAIKWALAQLGMGTVTKATAAANAATQLAADKTMGISAAGLAGAQGVASFAAAPWPIDMGAPAFGASMAAAALSFNAFEKGGIVPDTGLAMLHQNEMVLPRPIAEKVQAMADPESSRGRSRGSTVNNNFSISTPNANSFMYSQSQIDAKAHAASTKALRRNGG